MNDGWLVRHLCGDPYCLNTAHYALVRVPQADAAPLVQLPAEVAWDAFLRRLGLRPAAPPGGADA